MGKDDFMAKFGPFNQIEEELVFCTSRRNIEVVKCVKRIQTKSVREIKKLLFSKGVSLSLGTIISLKPFYVQPATECEKASCLCKKCLNLKSLCAMLLMNV